MITEPKLILKLWIPSYRKIKKAKGIPTEKMLSVVPSLNELFAMHHRVRDQRKKEIQSAMLSALSPSGYGSSMRTTSAQNTCAIFYDTAARYLTTRRDAAKLKSHNARLKKKSQSIPK